MGRLKIEVFLSAPPCSNSAALARLLDEIAEEYKEDIEIIAYEGRTEAFDTYNLTATPAVVIEELVKMMGFCPSKESLVSALKEVGLE
jgi:thiol-disulfide isomerase/thioredoxin